VPLLLQVSARSVVLHLLAMRTTPTSFETHAWMMLALDTTVA
jgi:hypothetical protein